MIIQDINNETEVVAPPALPEENSLPRPAVDNLNNLFYHPETLKISQKPVRSDDAKFRNKNEANLVKAANETP